jgi:hypothetical protein
VTGTYSSLRFGTEDLTGIEITVVYGGHGYFAMVQCAEGEPGTPVLVPAQVSSTTLTFLLPASSQSGCPAGAFRGTISSKGLTGNFEGESEPSFLKRGRSYWQ